MVNRVRNIFRYFSLGKNLICVSEFTMAYLEDETIL